MKKVGAGVVLADSVSAGCEYIACVRIKTYAVRTRQNRWRTVKLMRDKFCAIKCDCPKAARVACLGPGSIIGGPIGAKRDAGNSRGISSDRVRYSSCQTRRKREDRG